jgi:predicted Zn-dependent peptidase
LKDLRENNYAYPVQMFMRTLFGDHPYAQPAIGTAETVSKLTSKDLQDWFKTNQRSLLPTIFIVGDARGTGLVASIADLLTNEDLHERDIATLLSPS